MSEQKLTEYKPLRHDNMISIQLNDSRAGRSTCRPIQMMCTERAEWLLGSGKRANKIRCVGAQCPQRDLFDIYIFVGRDAEVPCDQPYATSYIHYSLDQ